ncbi:hypothetical protein [Clostridium thailandense]|uniref:hypothetical protein n=1 Tax=Clostridium thailandense TaxID=2794346 RepID=UPI003989FB61
MDSTEVFVDSDYILALKTTDKYCCAWLSRAGSIAYDLISDNIKRQYKDKEDFIMQFAGVSNPHHEAFEISGCSCRAKDRITFRVWMYYHYTGEYIPPYKRPDNNTFIELIKIDEETWLVDKVTTKP